MTPNNRKRVLLISPQPFFQWRGSPIRVGFDALALAQAGFEVDLLTLPVGEEKDIPGVRVIRVSNPLAIKNVPIGPSPAKLLFDLFLLFKAISMALPHRYDFVHCIEDAGVIGVVIRKLTGARLIFEKHSDPSSYKKGRLRNLLMRVYGKVETFVARRADAIIGTGAGLAEQVRANRPKGRVHHIFDIPSSLVESAPDSAAARRASLCQRSGEILVTYAGSFAVYQGIEILFAAIPAVTREHPLTRFVIIGGSEAEIMERKMSLTMQGVEESVTFMGMIPPDELPNVLAASDILLSPRISGVNTPLKLLDYLKAGRAIVATDTTANRLILDETCAVMARPDPDAFGQGISRLIAAPDLRQKLGDEGKRLIAERYNFSEFKKLIEACYAGIA